MKLQRIVAIAITVALIASAGLVHVEMRNQLVALDVAVDTQWKQVENQLVRQYELLPKLAAVARTYASHEKEVLGNIAESRARYVGAAPVDKPQLASDLDGAVVNVLALAERYPELKADAQYRDLAYEIAGTKNRIAVERQRYNEIVGVLNARLRQLPWSLVWSGVEARSFYEPPAEQLIDPDLEI